MTTMGNDTFERTFTIKNRLGLHARAASLFVQLASKFAAEVFVEKDGLRVNGKSIMGVLILAAGCGSKITVSAQGQDARDAVQALGELIERGFDEDEV